MNLPEVSIIMPTFNYASYIRRAMDSVLKQTFSNWELIVWDDGSTDNTEEIVYAYSDSRIKYFYDQNHGLPYARNRAMEHAQGKYISFLDSDDEWTIRKLASQVNVMNHHTEIGFLFCDFINIIESTGENYRTFEKYARTMKLMQLEQIEPATYLIKERILESMAMENFLLPSAVMIRKEVLARTGPFNEEVHNMEDFELWWRMGLDCVCFAYINEVYVTRYKYPGSLSSPSSLTYQGALKVLDICSQEALSKGRNDLVLCLSGLYRNAWQHLIVWFGTHGDAKRMFGAFFQSMKYGLNMGSIRLLLKAIYGLIFN